MIDWVSTQDALTSPQATTVSGAVPATVRSSRLLIRSLHSSASPSSPTRRHILMRASSAVIFCPVALGMSLPFREAGVLVVLDPLVALVALRKRHVSGR